MSREGFGEVGVMEFGLDVVDVQETYTSAD